MINSWQITIINKFWIQGPKSFTHINDSLHKCYFKQYILQLEDFSSTFKDLEFLY